jgi:hypothetical protein
MAAALLILAIPLGASAQVYNRDRYNNTDVNRDQYDRMNMRDARDAINRLDNSTSRLESDLNYNTSRKVLGIFQFRTVDNNTVAQVRDFQRDVRQLRNASNNGRALDRSVNEAQTVLNSGVRLDRYLRLRTGSTNVDADLSDLRSSLHVLADAYGLNLPY